MLGLAVTVLATIACDNRIVERAAENYFPLETGDWWSYSDNDPYEPRQVYVEVESLTSVLGIECYPVTYSGEVRYLDIDARAVRQYRELVRNFNGTDYIVARGFLTRLQLPFVKGSSFADSISDSTAVAGIYVRGFCRINGYVSDFAQDELYGSVYKIIITTTETISWTDSIVTASSTVDEYYAPGIGLVRFNDGEGDFTLSEYFRQ